MFTRLQTSKQLPLPGTTSNNAGKLTSTKVCPTCGDPRLIHLRSINKKYCSVCQKYIPWYLDPGQKPLI